MESSGEKELRKVKLTDHAVRILATTDQKSEAFMKMIRSASLPKLYASLLAKYESKNSFGCCAQLEFELDFNPSVVADVVRAFRETVSLRKLGWI